MPAKKKATKKRVKKIKVKHLTNALYWSIKIQTQVRAILLTLDPDKAIAIATLLNGGGDAVNTPRVFNCPPAST